MDLIEATSIIFITLGGAATFFWAVPSFIGKIWADKYIESVKKNYLKEIEQFKNDLAVVKAIDSRYSDKQFELYTKLYHSLIDLKDMADILWEDACDKNLKNFSKQLKITKKEVEKSYLFLEESDYNKFVEIFTQFSQYEIGKTSILSLPRGDTHVDKNQIIDWVEYNRSRKNEYDNLLIEIREDFKRKIRGSN
jgi:hypothetical protein